MSEHPSAQHDDLVAFRRGMQSAFEPPPDQPGEDSQVTTTLVSWWNHLVCSTCGHTFRRGDRVRHDARTSAVVHLDPSLGCAVLPDSDSRTTAAGERDACAPDTEDLAQFADGLADT